MPATRSEIVGVGWDMATALSEGGDAVAKLIPGGVPALAQLTDDELLANTRRLAGKSNQLLAALLVHLAEVEARGAHRTRRCASLYTYCIYELRFSEDAAARRSAAARLVKEFPALFDAIADGELHLTGLLMVGPHLTLENHAEVLARAKFRTKKELAKLVRDLNPLPGVPDCIEALGPAPLRALRNPTWAESVAALCGPVRELPAGERPRDWANDETGCEEAERDALPVGPVPADLPPVTCPQHYQVQFTTVEEHANLIERAKALLARERPGATLGELHLEAMKVFVAALEKRKFGVTERPGKHESVPAKPESTESAEPPRQRGVPDRAESPRQRGRYIQAAERRAVYQRDGGRCSYVDHRGERCAETRYLEFHHLEPFARRGAHVVSNLALRCRAHNALAAEQDFGPELVAKKRDLQRHEALTAQGEANAKR